MVSVQIQQPFPFSISAKGFLGPRLQSVSDVLLVGNMIMAPE